MLYKGERDRAIRIAEDFPGSTVFTSAEGMVPEGDVVGSSHHEERVVRSRAKENFLLLFHKLD